MNDNLWEMRKRAVENLNLKNENKNLSNKLFHSFEIIGKSSNMLSIKDAGASSMLVLPVEKMLA